MMMLNDRWPADKARINHDVLGNQVASSVSYLIRVLEGRVEDETALFGFIRGEIVPWEGVERELLAVICRFEYEMSPVRMFESAPLKDISDEDKAWMSGLVHEIWWERNGMRSRRDACVSVLAECGTRWRALVEELTELLALADFRSTEPETGHSPQTVMALKACRAFHAKCQELRRALTRLPSKSVVSHGNDRMHTQNLSTSRKR